MKTNPQFNDSTLLPNWESILDDMKQLGDSFLTVGLAFPGLESAQVIGGPTTGYFGRVRWRDNDWKTIGPFQHFNEAENSLAHQLQAVQNGAPGTYWDRRLWHEPSVSELRQFFRSAKPQIDDSGQSGINWDPRTGKLYRLLDGAFLDPHQAAAVLSVAADDLAEWVSQRARQDLGRSPELALSEFN